MIFLYISLALLGFLPTVIILYKKYKTDKLRNNGSQAMGTIREVFGFSTRAINIVRIEYPVKETGEFISKKIRVAGLPYSVGDQVPLFYDPKKPHYMRLDYKKAFIPMLVFTLLIAGFVIFACFKIQKAIATGEM